MLPGSTNYDTMLFRNNNHGVGFAEKRYYAHLSLNSIWEDPALNVSLSSINPGYGSNQIGKYISYLVVIS